jgi:hypothetical protein
MELWSWAEENSWGPDLTSCRAGEGHIGHIEIKSQLLDIAAAIRVEAPGIEAGTRSSFSGIMRIYAGRALIE